MTITPIMQNEGLEPIRRLTKDLKDASYILSNKEARFLVDAYYQMQDNRIRAEGQIRSMTDTGEPNAVLQWLSEQNSALEKQIIRALDAYSSSSDTGAWAKEQKGIGPILTANLLAYIDIEQAPTAGHVWSYAGLDSQTKWDGKAKVEAAAKEFSDLSPAEFCDALCKKMGRKSINIKRRAENLGDGKLTNANIIKALSQPPWNAELKKRCWLIGESFVKVSGHEDAYYGQIYRQRKEYEQAKNEAGEYAEQARKKLEDFNIGKSTDAYKAYSKGMLPPAHINARAKRYAVKLFLSHFHHNLYVERFGKEPPAPYPISHMGHAHWIKPNQVKGTK